MNRSSENAKMKNEKNKPYLLEMKNFVFLSRRNEINRMGQYGILGEVKQFHVRNSPLAPTYTVHNIDGTMNGAKGKVSTISSFHFSSLMSTLIVWHRKSLKKWTEYYFISIS
jgi:hypothetical protein